MTENELISLCIAAKDTLPVLADKKTREEILSAIPQAIMKAKDKILAANAVDIENAVYKGIPNAMKDRLMLTDKRIEDIAEAAMQVKNLPDPLGIEYRDTRPNGLEITRHRVPLGIVAMIYEARPNVTADASVLCLKSGNAVILRGGSEAINTNIAMTDAIRGALAPFGAENAVSLVHDTDRSSVDNLIALRGYVDLVIPRGGAGLIRHVVDNARVPVIETGAGNCHVYVHKSADVEMAVNVTVNAKTSRPSVCNAAETLLCDREIAPVFLPAVAEALKEKGVEIRASEKAKKYIPDACDATEKDFATEYDDYIIAVGVVDDVRQAVNHIGKYGTHHSEAIIASDSEAVEYFFGHVDAAALYHNASTRFTDGGVFGMGAEIGISTQKLHVRGPFAMQALTTTQYRIYGKGQIR